MEVKVEEFIATSFRDRKTVVKPALWRVRVDGMHAGFIKRKGNGLAEGAKITFHLRYPEWEREEIERKVAEHFGVEDVGSSSPSEVTPVRDVNTDSIMGDLE